MVIGVDATWVPKIQHSTIRRIHSNNFKGLGWDEELESKLRVVPPNAGPMTDSLLLGQFSDIGR